MVVVTSVVVHGAADPAGGAAAGVSDCADPVALVKYSIASSTAAVTAAPVRPASTRGAMPRCAGGSMRWKRELVESMAHPFESAPGVTNAPRTPWIAELRRRTRLGV